MTAPSLRAILRAPIATRRTDPMSRLTITDAQGRVKEVRNALHAFGALHPFTFGTATLVVGLVLGAVFL